MPEQMEGTGQVKRWFLSKSLQKWKCASQAQDSGAGVTIPPAPPPPFSPHHRLRRGVWVISHQRHLRNPGVRLSQVTQCVSLCSECAVPLPSWSLKLRPERVFAPQRS